MSRVLVFSCIHAPFVRKGFLEFLKAVKKKYQCDVIVSLGDELDFHALSTHPKHPERLGLVDELDAGIKVLKEFYKAFPKVYCCVSNHTSRPYRRAAEVDLGVRFLQSYNSILQAPPGWQWQLEWIIDDVKYVHGDRYGATMGGSGNTTPHKKAAINEAMNVVIGHFHQIGGIEWLCNDRMRWFGMCVGSGADHRTYAMQYAEGMPKKPMIGCGVVIDGKLPIYVPMELGTKIKILR